MNNYKDMAVLAMFSEQFIALRKNNNVCTYTEGKLLYGINFSELSFLLL